MLFNTLRNRFGASVGLFAVLLILLSSSLVLSGCGKGDSEEARGEVVKKKMALNLPDDLKEVDLRAVEDISPPAEPAEVIKKPEPVKVATPEPLKKPELQKPAPVKTAKKPDVKWVQPKAPVEKGAIVRKKRAVKKPAAPKPAVTARKTAAPKKTAVSSGSYAISVASYQEMDHANTLKERLEANGYSSYITSFTKEGVKWYRVRVGFFKSGAEADVALTGISNKLKVEGAWVVKPSETEIARHSR